MGDNLTDKPSEHLPTWGIVDVLSRELYDPSNHWRDFLCVTRLDKQAKIPTRGSAGAAGYDLYPFEQEGMIPAWGKAVVGTKIKVSFPPGLYGRIASRSGLSFKHDLEVGAGVIDSDYQGEIMVIVRNHSDTPFTYTRDKAIAQLILESCTVVPIKEVSNLEDLFGTTERGANGFGSTDRH